MTSQPVHNDTSQNRIIAALNDPARRDRSALITSAVERIREHRGPAVQEALRTIDEQAAAS